MRAMEMEGGVEVALYLENGNLKVVPYEEG
jgi:hypothetical protein